MNKDEIIGLFQDFNNQNILIIGDVMVDAYYFGSADRTSPEAPVPIVSVKNKESRLGGAANVALNLKALGATPILCSVIGNDIEGKRILALLEEDNLSTNGLLTVKDRITTVKTRIIGNQQQLLRVDDEDESPISTEETKVLIERINSILATTKIDVVVFQDYDKGVITPTLIDKIAATCRTKNIPTAVDPKKRNFNDYKNISLFKPNLKELNEGLNLNVNPSNTKEVENAINQLHKELSNQIYFVTLSEYGVFIKNQTTQNQIPAHARNITDVSGAGDTVISVAALCLGLNQPIHTIAEISNLAGGLVCESIGVVPINKNELLSEAISNLT